MSYHVAQPRRVSRRSAAAMQPVYQPLPTYPLLPLADATAPAPKDKTRELLMVLAVVVIIALVLWWVDQRNQKSAAAPRSRAKKQSTAAMSKNLYERLEKRGGVSDTTMRSLKQLSRNA